MDVIIENIVTILLVNGAILIVPGVNFFLIARFAVLEGVLPGVYCAVGVTSAIMLHVVFSIISVEFFLKNYPNLFLGIRYVGAVYLFFLGTQFLMSALSKNIMKTVNSSGFDSHNKSGFYTGFFTDLFNPFISIFYLSLFSLINPKIHLVFELSCYFFTIFVITFCWFGFVAFFFTRSFMLEYFQNKSKQIQAMTGLALYFFSARLFFDF